MYIWRYGLQFFKNLFYTVQTKIVSSTTSTVIKNTDTNLLCPLAAVVVTSDTAARAGMLDLHVCYWSDPIIVSLYRFLRTLCQLSWRVPAYAQRHVVAM